MQIDNSSAASISVPVGQSSKEIYDSYYTNQGDKPNSFTDMLFTTLFPKVANNFQTNYQAALDREYNAWQSQLDRDYNASEAQKNRDFQERMSNTAYQRLMQDLKKAGINPVMAFQSGASSSVPSGASGASGSHGSSGHGSNVSGSSGALDIVVGLAKVVSGLVATIF